MPVSASWLRAPLYARVMAKTNPFGIERTPLGLHFHDHLTAKERIVRFVGQKKGRLSTANNLGGEWLTS